MKGRTNLISFGKVTYLVDEGKAVDIFYVNFSKVFDCIPHSIQLDKLTAHGLDGCTVHWIKKWLDGQAWGVMVNGDTLSQWPVSSGVSQH